MINPVHDTGPLPLAEQAYQVLKAAIVRCDFAPGQRLGVEELSQRFGFSNSPLREALNRLTQLGLVVALENRGFRVAPLTAEGVQDLTRVRLLVEVEALRDALRLGDDHWESRVVAAAHGLSLIESRMDPGPLSLNEEWSARHRDFHLTIYSGSTSPLLKSLVDGLFDHAERYRRFSARYRDIDRSKNTEHQSILNAVLARKEEKAITLLRKHISNTELNVTRALQQPA